MHLGLQHLSTVSSRTSPHRPPQLCRRQPPRLAVPAQGQVKSPSRLTLDHVEISYFCFYWGYSWGALCSLRCISHYSWVYPLTHVICSLLVQPCASKDAQAARLRRLCEKNHQGVATSLNIFTNFGFRVEPRGTNCRPCSQRLVKTRTP